MDFENSLSSDMTSLNSVEFWLVEADTSRPTDLLECAAILSDLVALDSLEGPVEIGEMGKQMFPYLSEELQTLPEMSGNENEVEEDAVLSEMSPSTELHLGSGGHPTVTLFHDESDNVEFFVKEEVDEEFPSTSDSFASSEYFSSGVDSSPFSEGYAELAAVGYTLPLQQTMDCGMSDASLVPESSENEGSYTDYQSTAVESEGCRRLRSSGGRKQTLITRDVMPPTGPKSRMRVRRKPTVSVGSDTSSEDMENQRKVGKTLMYKMTIEGKNLTPLEKKNIIKSKKSKDYREKVKNNIKTLEGENLTLKQDNTCLRAKLVAQENALREKDKQTSEMKAQLACCQHLIDFQHNEIESLKRQLALQKNDEISSLKFQTQKE